MMVANEGLEKAEPIEAGHLGLTALHPLRGMQISGETPSRTHLLIV